MNSRVLLLGIAPVVWTVGCGGSVQTVSGGDVRFDAGSPGAPFPELSDAAGDGGGATWSALYADYFGTMGRASCAGSGSCHGSMSQPGYASSKYLCPPGDQTGCYSGITSAAAGLLVKIDGTMAATFADTYLYSVLRKSPPSGLGNMPQSPAYTFTDTDLARLFTWFQAGAKND
jgi:hypothetical protein